MMVNSDTECFHNGQYCRRKWHHDDSRISVSVLLNHCVPKPELGWECATPLKAIMVERVQMKIVYLSEAIP